MLVMGIFYFKIGDVLSSAIAALLISCHSAQSDHVVRGSDLIEVVGREAGS